MAIAGRYPNDGIKRIGYPTEKPYKLIERIILTSSNNNSIVFDPFMGSGVVQMVAMKTGRRFLVADDRDLLEDRPAHRRRGTERKQASRVRRTADRRIGQTINTHLW